MNREHRQPYRDVLALLQGATLCTFCRFGQGVGWGDSPCQGGGWTECQHPIASVAWELIHEDMLEPGADCWGYRPKFPMAVIADIVGMILGGGFISWGFTHFPDTGKIIVGGELPPQPVVKG